MSMVFPATTQCRADWKRKHNHPCFCAVTVLEQDEFTNLPTDEESARIEATYEGRSGR